MAKLSILAGTTSKLLDLFAQDSSVATGAGLTGLVFNTASLTAYYYREGAASAVAITLATMTLGTWATGGFIVVDATNLPGVYQLGIPNAALAAGAKSVLIMLKGAANLAPIVLEIELTAVDNQDAVRGGMTSLPNAAAEAAGGLYTRGSGAGQVNQQANGQHDVNVVRWLNTAPVTPNLAGVPIVDPSYILRRATAAAGAASTITLDASANATDSYYRGTKIAIVSGTGAGQARIVTAYVGATKVATVSPAWVTNPDSTSVFEVLPIGSVNVEAWESVVPNVLISGRVDTSVGAMAADVVTAAAIATDAIGSAELAASAVTEIQTGLATSAALATVQTDTDDIQTRLPAALVSGRMDSSVGAMAASVLTATAIATDAITAAKIAADAIGAAELAADAVTEIQSGLATASALATVAAFVDTEVASTLAAVDTEVAAIKAVTDLLPNGGALTNLDAAVSSRATPAQVNAEVVDVLTVDVHAEPGQAAPAATATLAVKIGWLFKAWRNKSTQDSTTFKLFADDAVTVDNKATVADTGSEFSRSEIGSGP